MMAAPTPMAFGGMVDCALTIWQEDGAAGFFCGGLAHAIRGFITALIITMWYELQFELAAKIFT